MLSQKIKQKAHEIGFELVGVASAMPNPDSVFYQQWLEKGFHARMAWMERHLERKRDPQKILEGAKSFIMCGLSYNKPYPRSIDSQDDQKLWVSNYAWGEDYHLVVLKKLQELETYIQTLTPEAKQKSYVDTGAILERSYARDAGLGWVGKNTLLINQKYGSFFFIGEIITTLELEPDSPDRDHCGTCTRCLDACPTQALTPYELDARKCISYLTIEHRGFVEAPLNQQMGHHMVGCDICQDVCPWNKKAPYTSQPAFEPKENLLAPNREWASQINQENFKIIFQGSPIKRLKFENWERNLALSHKESE